MDGRKQLSTGDAVADRHLSRMNRQRGAAPKAIRKQKVKLKVPKIKELKKMEPKPKSSRKRESCLFTCC